MVITLRSVMLLPVNLFLCRSVVRECCLDKSEWCSVVTSYSSLKLHRSEVIILDPDAIVLIAVGEETAFFGMFGIDIDTVDVGEGLPHGCLEVRAGVTGCSIELSRHREVCCMTV